MLSLEGVAKLFIVIVSRVLLICVLAEHRNNVSTDSMRSGFSFSLFFSLILTN